MSEATPKKPGFPIGLTIATLIAFATLCGLGTWQVKRLAWKEDLLARIEKLKTAPAIPLAQALARADKGEDVTWTRVATDCGPPSPSKVAGGDLSMIYGVREGQIVWRGQAVCWVEVGKTDVIRLDLGVVDALTGQPAPPDRLFTAPGRVTGVLIDERHLGKRTSREPSVIIRDGMSSYLLMVETATPAVPGVTPAPLPAEISNRHLEYALTWFGLAVTLLFIYAAMLWRRMRP